MEQVRSGYFSRPEVIEMGVKAWAIDGKFKLFYFDGHRFWRLGRRRDWYLSVGSHRVPEDGWMHAEDCACEQCSEERWSWEEAAEQPGQAVA